MFTEKDIEFANSVNIMNLIEYLGYKYEKVGKNEYKIQGFGGLYFNSEHNNWYCFTTSEGGSVVQFLTIMEEKSWVNAIKYLLDNFNKGIAPDKPYGSGKGKLAKENEENKEEIAESVEISLPTKAEKYKRLYAYLIKTRKLDKSIVDFFVKKGLIYENDKGGIVFLGKDKEDEVRYAMVRGTAENKPFKSEIKNSDKAYGFNVTNHRSEKLVVFEAPIDLMSYMSIKVSMDKNYLQNIENLVSLGGVSDKALVRILDDNKQIRHVEFALDNDEKGEEATERLAARLRGQIMLSRLIFKGKDVNEHLMNFVGSNELSENLLENKDVDLSNNDGECHGL